MSPQRRFLTPFVCAALLVVPVAASGQPPPTAAAPAADATTRLYAVEIKVGARWVVGRPPQEQDYFREHSANLRKLREQGSLVLGARYGDKGLVILAAASEGAARAMIEQDPSIGHGTFSYELQPFSVFYGGTVDAPRRP
jgi:uncharacterized protein YciI